MAHSTTRDLLARQVYVECLADPVVGLTAAEQEAGAREWDRGLATPQDVAECYILADKMIDEGRIPDAQE